MCLCLCVSVCVLTIRRNKALLCSYSVEITAQGWRNQPLLSPHNTSNPHASRGSCSSCSAVGTGPGGPSGARRVDPCNLGYLAERDAALGFRFPPGGRDPHQGFPGLAPVERAARRVLINCRIGGARAVHLLACAVAGAAARRDPLYFLAAPLHDRCPRLWCLVAFGWVCLPCRRVAWVYPSLHCTHPIYSSRGPGLCACFGWTCLVPHLTRTLHSSPTSSILPTSVFSVFFCSVLT